MAKKKATTKTGPGEIIWVSPHDLHNYNRTNKTRITYAT